MATRGRKYTGAAPETVRQQSAEAAEAEERTDPTMRERHADRMRLLRRAGRGMLQNSDTSWRPVALWLSKAVRASEQAWFFGDKTESPVLPGGELDYCCQTARAYLARHGEGDPEFARSDRCPKEFKERPAAGWQKGEG